MYNELMTLIKTGYISADDQNFLIETAKKCDRLFEEGIIYKDSKKLYEAETARKEIYTIIQLLYDELTYDCREDISTYETCDY